MGVCHVLLVLGVEPQEVEFRGKLVQVICEAVNADADIAGTFPEFQQAAPGSQ